MRLSKPSRLYGVVLSLSIAACSSNKHSSVGASVGTGHSNDGGARVGAGKDAGSDAGYDTQIYAGDHYLCGYDQADLLGFDGNASLHVLTSATDERGFALIHLDAADNVFIEGVPIAGAAQSPVTLLDANERVEAATIVASAGHFLLAWRSASGGQHLRARELSGPGQATTELSANLALPDGGGELFAASPLANGFALAFFETGDGASSVRVRQLSVDGQALGATATLDGVAAKAPLHLQLAPLDSGGALLGWLEEDASGNGQVSGIPLSPALAIAGSANVLSKNAVSEPVFGLSARQHSEGLIYHALDGDTRDTVKYRRVESSGVAEQAVLNMVNAPGRARDGSIAPFGQGYAVAYRKLPSLGDDKATIHVGFVNEYGQSVYDAELGETSEAAGPTTVAATADGHVFVGWTNTLPASATTSALKLYCPGALELCGGSQ